MSLFKMKRGQESKVNSLAKEDGSLIFSLNGANNSTVRLDQTVNGTVQRLGIAVDKAKDADGVIDYNEPTRHIKIGYAGAGLSTSNLNYIAGYTNNGTQIKDVSKDVLKNWLGTMGSADSAKVIEPFENATANASRNVWFSDSEVRNKPVYNDNFKYNPITQILTTNISGSAEFANLIKYYQSDSQFYASGDTHIMELGYLKCDGSYQNLTLYITSAFWGNQHGSADFINIQQDTNTNSSATVQSYVHAIRVGGNYDRTFYAYKDQTNKRLYLYVQVTGGNSYGKWNVSVIQCSSGYNAWVSEFGFNKILPMGHEIISKIFLGTSNNSNALGGSSLSQILTATGGGNAFTAIDTATNNTVKLTRANGGTVQKIINNVSNASSASYATISAYPQGFSSRTTSATWGNTTGSFITGWHTNSGGDLAFLNNNPASGQLSLKIDGVFYQREGSYKVIDEGGGTFKGPIALSYNTNNIMSTATTNPQIIFSENGSQPVALAYTDYDSYRNPAGLKVVGKSADSSPAWFEVEGALYSNTVNASTVTAYLNGTAKNSNALGGSSLSQVLSAAGSGKYLPLSGGVLTGPLSLQSTLKGITTQSLSGNTIKTGNNAVTITLPTSNNDTSNAMYMYANQNGNDIGIIYISPDTAFIANSGDTGYVFRVIDKDINQDTNSNTGMLFGVRESKKGLDVRSSIFPTDNSVYSLGSSSLKWNNAYASTFHGYLNGIASNAQKLEGHPASYFAVASGTSSNVVENGMYLLSNTSQVNNRFSVKNGQLTSGNTNFPSNLLLAAASTDYPQLAGDSSGTTKNYSILHFGNSAYRHDIVMACSGTNTGIIYAFATTANTGGRLARIMDSLNYSGYMYRFDNQITFSKGLIANSPSSTVLIDGGSYTGGTQSGGSGGGTGTQSLSIRVEGTKLIITTK